jgi:ribosome-binding factor A
MEFSKRQIQIGKAIQAEMMEIFQKEGLNILNNGMISISTVKVTPDLFEARIYISFFQIPEPEKMLEAIIARTSEFRGKLGNRMRNTLRNVPTLTFYSDDTLDHVFKMEALFKQIEDERIKPATPAAPIVDEEKPKE